jgi:hypothetical protein
MRDRKMMDPQLALAAALLGALSAEAVIPPPCGDKSSRNPRTNAARVAGPGRIFYFSYQLSAFSF